MPLSVGTSAVGLTAFDRPGDQGTPHDAGRIGHSIEDFQAASFEGVSSYGFVRFSYLISSIHDKILSQRVEDVYHL